MRLLSRFFALAFLISVLALSRRAATNTRAEINYGELAAMRNCANPESRFALGEAVSVAEAGLYELTLISGVSDGLANEIVFSKQRILARALSYPQAERYRSLEVVHGIAGKKAETLRRYLSFNSAVPPSAKATCALAEGGEADARPPPRIAGDLQLPLPSVISGLLGKRPPLGYTFLLHR